MSQQIKKKWLGDNEIGSDKILIEKDKGLMALNQSSVEVALIKINASGNVELLGAEAASKSYADSAASSAASGKLDASAVGVTVASLVDGKVPSTQLPSYVDDVEEYNNLAAFPASGEASKIYIAKDTSKVYRWSGSVYVEIVASPGSTDSVPEGSLNLYYTNARAAAAAPVQSVAGKTGTVTLGKSDVGLGNVDNTSDADKPISSATQTALNAKQASLGTGTTSQYLRGDLTWAVVESLIFTNEKFTLSATDITNQYIDLAYEAKPETMSAFVMRLAMHSGDDYTLSVVSGKTRLTFAGECATAGNSALAAGDIVRVKYAKA